jgi:hypothetical protein
MAADRTGKGGAGNDALRQDRLKSKLRENLKRRKFQERARGKMRGAPVSDQEPSPDGEVGKRGD